MTFALPAPRDTYPRLAQAVKGPLRRLRSDYRRLTAGLRGLPGLVIIGAQKGGTTSLFNYLVQHPDVRSPLTKEIHFFDLNYEQGPGWYRGRFPFRRQLRDGVLTLDASPYYLTYPLAPARAAQLLPDAKLVALLRNPVDRALSHYEHEVRGGRESLSFAEAIAREPDRLAGEEEKLAHDPSYYSYAHHRYSYLRRGIYVDQLQRWVEHFPRSQMLILQSEALFEHPHEVTQRVLDFLGLRPFRLPRYGRFYPGAYDRDLPSGLRRTLADYFEPYNQALYRWLGEEYDWT
jgi:sulfotransferase family protein